MRELSYTLLSDGSSDKALLPIISWLLDQHGVRCPIHSEWADFRLLPRPPRNLRAKIEQSLHLYPCDLLFVHRDAENLPYTERKAEIIEALADVNTGCPPTVCVVPVRMMEAWLLFDESALWRASGNPIGRVPLHLPPPAAIEQLPDPKTRLHEILRAASELSGRRLKKLKPNVCATLVANLSRDFAQLRLLPAFRALEDDVIEIINRNSWAEQL